MALAFGTASPSQSGAAGATSAARDRGGQSSLDSTSAAGGGGGGGVGGSRESDFIGDLWPFKGGVGGDSPNRSRSGSTTLNQGIFGRYVKWDLVGYQVSWFGGGE